MVKNLILKTSSYNLLIFVCIFIFFVQCSIKKDNYSTRNWQALNTKYNVLFNGNEAYDKGIVSLKTQHTDNFWEILPIERQAPLIEENVDEKPKKSVIPEFELSENKAVKAVQKRSIYINGSERNYQIDETYLLLGKARYFDNRFIPALEAFNYILYKYPSSSNILEAKIWREKTNIRLDNDEIAIKNLITLLKEIKIKNQIYSDANAILAQAFIKIELKDSAVYRLKKALEYTKSKEEKSRYHFILGQLYEDLNNKEEAFKSYQSVIDMNRKSPRQYIIQAQVRQASQFDIKNGDTIVFLKKYNKLLLDRENRPYLDVLHHHIALFYEKLNQDKQAIQQYKLSLKNKKYDQYLEASNHRNLATIYFHQAKYSLAGKYYDSTLVKLNPKTKEFILIKKKKDNLEDVIKYEEIANRNDSILNILSMTEVGKKEYFEKYISRLILIDSKAKSDNLNEKITKKSSVVDKSDVENGLEIPNSKKNIMPPSFKRESNDNISSNFYFYNANTIEFGKSEFKKKWGERELKNNWRLIEGKTNEKNYTASNPVENTYNNPKYSVDFYINKLPKKDLEITEMINNRNFAYYQLGVIYNEKFKEYYLARDKFESLLTKNPEEKLILPSMYNLYKIYQIIDKNKALGMKNEIINKYPNSRYAQILSGNNIKNSPALFPEIAYKDLYKKYLNGDYRNLLKLIEIAINEFSGEEIISKMELLKANVIGKIQGLEAFKKALTYVALTYPNSEEGKKTQKFLDKDIVEMENLQFNKVEPNSWKVLYKIGDISQQKGVELLKKITLFSEDRSPKKPIFSIDLYKNDENFVVLHGWKTQDIAKGIATILAEYKDYKVEEKPIIISNENYKIVQIKKNLVEYLLNINKVAVGSPEISKMNTQTLSNQKNESNEKIFENDNINISRRQKNGEPPEIIDIKEEDSQKFKPEKSKKKL